MTDKNKKYITRRSEKQFPDWWNEPLTKDERVVVREKVATYLMTTGVDCANVEMNVSFIKSFIYFLGMFQPKWKDFPQDDFRREAFKAHMSLYNVVDYKLKVMRGELKVDQLSAYDDLDEPEDDLEPDSKRQKLEEASSDGECITDPKTLPAPMPVVKVETKPNNSSEKKKSTVKLPGGKAIEMQIPFKKEAPTVKPLPEWYNTVAELVEVNKAMVDHEYGYWKNREKSVALKAKLDFLKEPSDLRVKPENI